MLVYRGNVYVVYILSTVKTENTCSFGVSESAWLSSTTKEATPAQRCEGRRTLLVVLPYLCLLNCTVFTFLHWSGAAVLLPSVGGLIGPPMDGAVLQEWETTQIVFKCAVRNG